MDKKERKGDQGPRNISHRSRNLFNSIINLTPLGIKTPTQRLSPADFPSPTNRKVNNDTINLSGKRRKSASQSPSSCSSMSSTGGGGGGGVVGGTGSFGTPLLGPAPKTFSILTALNELSISNPAENVQCVSSCRESESITSQQISNTRCRITVPHESEPGHPFYSNSATFTDPPPHLKSTDQVAVEKFLRRKQLLQPCQQTKASELLSDNGRIKSHQTRTPEWIRKIFLLASHGKLIELVESLKGLDLTVIRHLADLKGRTLLHCAASGGHLSVLKWLVSTLGPLADAGLNDLDDEGRTPVLVALKKRRMECFQWLVLTTKAGEAALVAEDGERSLLHFGASYGDLIAVRWLSKCLKERGSSMDMKDNSSGMTPLCEAAQAGHLSVCHELIVAGANPLYQTEFGWRPVDFAICQRQLECVNYLMMAETAASLGNELHSRVKEMQTIQQEHDSLRNHFRELLRVGKWLVKDRTDLIRKFSSIGLKTPAEASILLGESSNGTRFSDFEHKLAQAEQASRHLRITSNASGFKPSLANDNTFNLQDILVAAQLRCENMLSANAANVSDEEKVGGNGGGCGASMFSSDADDTNLLSYLDINKLHKQAAHCVRTKYTQKCVKSLVAPWLLASSDSILAQLSPLVSQLDLLDTPYMQPNTAPFFTTNANNQVSDPNSSSARNHDSMQKFSFDENFPQNSLLFSQPTVVEVVEPHLVSIKGTPDLIRETKRSEPVEEKWLKTHENNREKGESIYSEINKSSTCSSPQCESMSNEFAPMNHLSSNKHQKHPSYNALPLPAEPINPHPSSKDHFFDQTTPIQNKIHSEPCVTKVETGKSERGSAHGSILPLFKSETRVLIESPPTLLPKLPVSVELAPNLELTASQDEISCGSNLVYVPPESISTSTTPVMLRSFSSHSHTSSTVLFPFKKGKWVSPEPLLVMNPNSNKSATGKLSPSPSESSRTESALAPPPSNASHGSHTSEGSKTESARDILLEPSVDMPAHVQNSRELNADQDLEAGDLSGNSARQDGNEEAEEDNQCRKMSFGSVLSQNVQNAQCILKPFVSSGIHKVSIHHVTKRGRRQTKAWYEMEGSDDEEEGSIVPKTRSRSTRSSKLSNSSPSSSSDKSENDEHECDPSCAQHNCPDFV